MTLASHARGPEFDSRSVYLLASKPNQHKPRNASPQAVPAPTNVCHLLTNSIKLCPLHDTTHISFPFTKCCFAHSNLNTHQGYWNDDFCLVMPTRLTYWLGVLSFESTNHGIKIFDNFFELIRCILLWMLFAMTVSYGFSMICRPVELVESFWLGKKELKIVLNVVPRIKSVACISLFNVIILCCLW